MNGFPGGFPGGMPGMGGKGFDPSKIDPAQLKMMLNMFSGMSDEQIKNQMKMFGIDMDPSVIRSFIDKMKNASDEDLNKLKEQYAKGNIKMNSFNVSVLSKFEDKLKEAKKLCEENKFEECIELCNKSIENIKNEKIEEKDKEEQKKFIEKFYDQLTLARYTSQDYDDTIKECQKAIDDNYPLFSIYNRMGICFFKKGRHVKARDAFLKAKEKFPNEEDKIAEKYLKMALEEIENY